MTSAWSEACMRVAAVSFSERVAALRTGTVISCRVCTQYIQTLTQGRPLYLDFSQPQGALS